MSITTYDVSQLSKLEPGGTVEGGTRTITVRAIGESETSAYSLMSESVTYAFPYKVDSTLTYTTADSSNVDRIYPNSSATLTYYSNNHYSLPTTPIVTGSSISSWTRTTEYEVQMTGTNVTINGVSSYNEFGSSTDILILGIASSDPEGYRVPYESELPSFTNATVSYTRHSETYAVLTITNLNLDNTGLEISGVHG